MNTILLKNPKKSFIKRKIWAKTIALLLFFMVFSITNVNAQIAITVTGNTNTTPNLATSYTSIANALNALNAVTAMTGSVTFQALSAGTEVAPPKGFTIGSATLNPLLSATKTITILGGGQTITAGVGNATPASASPDGIIKIVGADYVNIQNFTLRDNNTTNPATMEFGIGLFKLNNNDGCKNNSVQSLDIYMQSVNDAAGALPMPSGSSGIIMVNSTPTAAITSLTPTAASGSNSDNTFQGNGVTGGINGIYLFGFPDVSPFTFVDYNTIVNGNNVQNYGTNGATNVVAQGIYANNQFNILIDTNGIYNNISTGHLYNLYGILNIGAAAVTPTITNNTITLRNFSSNFQSQGILNGCGTGSTVNINSNTVRFGYPNGVNPAAVGIRAINNTSVPTTLNIAFNTIEGIAGVPIAGTGETNFIINNTTTITPNVNTNNNIIRNFERTGSSGFMYAIRIFATNWTANANVIDNLKFSAVGSTGSINGLSTFGATANSTLSNNILSNLSIPFTGSIYGIYEAGASGTKIMNSNQIFNIATSAGGTGGSTFNGIYIGTGTTTVSNNSIYSLNISGTDATVTSSVNGIYLDSATNLVFNNKLYDFSANSTLGLTNGIYTAATTQTIYNNVISDLRAPNTNQANGVNGFNINGTATLYYNSILLNETVKNGPNAGSNTVNYRGNGTLISRNNIYINKSVVGASGKASALYCANFAVAYDPSSNNNLLNASTIFTDGINSDITLAAFKTRMATRDQASVTETTTPFTSLVGSNAAFLQLATNAVSVANNNALPITSPAITTDYFGVIRSTSTPDIGASEFTGFVCTTPTFTSNPPNRSICAGSNTTFSVAATSATTYQWQVNNGSGFADISNGGVYSGATTSTLTITGATATMSGYLYRAVAINVVNTCFTNSNSGTLFVSNITSSGTTINVSCFGGSNGTAVVTATGGIGGYTYSWSPSGGTGTVATGLSANTYTVTITDGIGCTATRTFTINAPSAIVLTAASQTNIACNGGSNGAAAVNTATGGAGGYTYNWTPGTPTGDGTTSITGLTAGTWTCTVTDGNGCTRTQSFAVTQPSAIVLTAASQTNIACNGGSTGTAGVNPSGGASPYTYSWTNGATTNAISGLIAGTYTVTVTDVIGCTATRSFTITQPSALSGSTSQTNVACFGGSTGAINLTPSGGTAPYTFNWGGGITTEDRTGLASGTYSVTITDANGCTATNTNIISQPSAITATISQTNASCRTGSNGTATIVASGGAGSYTYSWSPSGGAGATATGLIAGTYTCTVTDANACSISRVYSITQPTAIAATITRTDVSCNSGANGAAVIVVSGGTGGYTYNWTPGNPTGNGTTSVTGLVAGTYTCTVTDANGCAAARPFTITQPSAVSGTTVVTNISCFGGSNGAINLTPSGGTAPYTFNWGGGITTEDRTGLAAGSYTVTINDANGCTGTVSGIVTQPTAISGSTFVTNIACNGFSTGAINLTPSGGTAPYTFNWGGGITTEDRTGLAAGTYSVIITDNNGCTVTVSGIVVTQPTAITTSASQVNVACFGGTNGSATVSPSGGTPGYTYAWSNGSNTNTASGLNAGTHVVTVTDANGCTATRSFTLTQPASAVSGTTVVTNVACNGGSNGAVNLTPAGGTAPYTFNWGGGITTEDRTGLVAGTYSVTITDANGCTTNTNATVTEPAAINNSVTQASGVLTATQSGAAYQWYNCTTGIIAAATNQTFTPSIVGDYRVTITLNGCSLDSNCITVTTLSANDFDTANFSYYPNPTTGILNLNYSTDIDTIQVSTILGQVVLSKTINAKEAQVDLQFLPSGTYLVKITANDKTKVIKVVKN